MFIFFPSYMNVFYLDQIQVYLSLPSPAPSVSLSRSLFYLHVCMCNLVNLFSEVHACVLRSLA